jgi:dipeptidyl aminopeptidase/acylaminoacyl peptidase
VDSGNKDPLWTPDGKKLLFLGDSRKGNALWSIRVADGRGDGSPELVKEGIDTLLGVSQEGEYYYQTKSITKDLYMAEIDPRTGKLTTKPAGTSRYLNEGATWSPDGEYLTYYSRRGADKPLVLVLLSSRTGEERVLVPKSPLDMPFEKPQWFPDSRSLFVHSTNGKLCQLDVQTGECRLLLADTLLAGQLRSQHSLACFGPDGRDLLWSYDGHDQGPFSGDLAGGPEKKSAAWRPIEGLVSPDGSRLAFGGETSLAGAGCS